MRPILTAAQMYAADQATIAGGVPSEALIKRAAKAVFDVITTRFDTTHTLVLCGTGNNGADGRVLAELLQEKGKRAEVYCPIGANPPEIPPLEGFTVVVDALFGIGLSRPIEGACRRAIEQIIAAKLPVVAIDIPSGIHADTGALMGIALPAQMTVAVSAYKWGHLLYPGAAYCGEIKVADIGIPVEDTTGFLVRKSDLDELPIRPAWSHKGSFGRPLVIGGSFGMAGAGYLAAKAAYRAGCGLVEILSHKENRIIYQTALPEAVLTLYDPDALDETSISAALERADAVAVGMGLGCSPAAARLLELAIAAKRPLLIDADGLNLLAASPALQAAVGRRESPTVITPHLGEMARLCGCGVAEISADPKKYAADMAKRLGCTVVLKDARTLISHGEHCYLNIYGNNGMATGGSGDVLAGIIASLMAQGVKLPAAAYLGVTAHALAGDAAREKRGLHGLMAGDIIDGLCKALP